MAPTFQSIPRTPKILSLSIWGLPINELKGSWILGAHTKMQMQMRFTVVVWPGMGMDDPVQDLETFTKFMASRFPWLEHPVNVLGSLNNDLIFSIDTRDVPRFAIPRLEYGMRWLSDVLESEPDTYNTKDLMHLVSSVSSVSSVVSVSV